VRVGSLPSSGQGILRDVCTAIRRIRAGAILEAGRNAGSYLDEIGKTDLKMLSAGEWREFLARLLTGYEQALRRKLLNNEPPLDPPPL
jgi:hypothetical protein